MSKPAARAAVLVEEVARLERELAVLERQWARKHYLSAFALLALPALYFGGLYAVIVLLCTPALVGTQAYLIGVRRSECRELIREAQRELAQLRSKAAATSAATKASTTSEGATPPAATSEDATPPAVTPAAAG